MRRGLIAFLVINVFIVAVLVRSVFTLLTLLVEDGSADAIRSAEIPAPNSPLIDTKTPFIPKIIHQTYVNNSVPQNWRQAQRSCIELHPDYEYKLWTDEDSRELIATEYPWFLNTFDNYSYPIQRADAIRYFVLAHYGGIYIDLDDGCNRRLDPLLSYPAWLRRTAPTGISNDAMGSTPRHPFFLFVLDNLRSYDRSWVLPYVTVMYSTGPLFLSCIWKSYMDSGQNIGDGPDGGRVRVLMPEEYNKHSWSFFRWHGGSSWHGGDARVIFWMGRNWMMLTGLGFLTAGVVFMGLWWVYGRVLLLGQHRKGQGRWTAGLINCQGLKGVWMISLDRWRRRRGERGGKEYELLGRHEV